ncbi:MAG: DUF3500 domain-containing protein [Deltaproteobacteria bacterium]|nr:DUF3500 domain-containing protein [Deltaproteobacteria bacterium]
MVFVLVASLKVVYAQERYEEGALAAKKAFGDRERAALAEPFVGVRSGSSPAVNLFPVKATGVSTGPIRKAATKFLESLTPHQLIRTQFAIDDSEWRRWSNVDNGIFTRQGVSFRDMSLEQREAATGLVAASLSAEGLALTEAIRKTDQTLREINQDSLSFDEDLYFFTVMGVPSASEPWGWQLDGHHLVINYFVLGDQVVMTPAFFGGEPIQTTTGKYAGNVLLQEEQNLGLALLQSLSPEQLEEAVLSSRKTGRELQAGANQDNLILDYAGVSVSTFSEGQRTRLLALIARFVNNLPPGHAKVRMDEVLEHLEVTRFAWVGATSDDSVFYYRIHSPVLLVEFDHQSPVGMRKVNRSRQATRDHIHVIIRTPNGNDYGKDLLRQHLEDHAH